MHFHDELSGLKERILKMGSLVETSIRDCVRALIDRDEKLAQAVIAGDQVINALDVQIDEECIKLLALHQPMATDLRLITTIMKVTNDLERIADQSVNVAERALELMKEPILKPYIDIPRMREIVQGMTRDALDALVKHDKRLAMDVIIRDDEVDDLKYGILEELISYMALYPNTISRSMKISFVAQYLERMGDHATNIAEMVIYLVEGKLIRHKKQIMSYIK